MTRVLRNAVILFAALALLISTPTGFAQQGEIVEARVGPPAYTEGLEGVDFSGMTEDQKQIALKVLNDSACDCGCGMTVAQCRVEDQSCPRSPILARAITDAVRRGGDEAAAVEAYRSVIAGNRTLESREVAAFEIDVADSPSRGPKSAPVTIVEFSDFQCPFCVRAVPTIRQVMDLYPDEVRLVFKHYPLPIHARAREAALAAEAAGKQGKFWEMHDLLFLHPASMERTDLLSHAATLGLDVDLFEQDLDSEELAARVNRDVSEAVRVGVTGTPAFYVNGLRLDSYQLNAFRIAIEREMAEAAAGR